MRRPEHRDPHRRENLKSHKENFNQCAIISKYKNISSTQIYDLKFEKTVKNCVVIRDLDC
jgi:hypothetical protein